MMSNFIFEIYVSTSWKRIRDSYLIHSIRENSGIPLIKEDSQMI